MRKKHMRHINKIAPKRDDIVVHQVGVRIFRRFNPHVEGGIEEIPIPSKMAVSASRQYRKRIKRAVRGMSHKDRRDFYAAIREEASAQEAAAQQS